MFGHQPGSDFYRQRADTGGWLAANVASIHLADITQIPRLTFTTSTPTKARMAMMTKMLTAQTLWLRQQRPLQFQARRRLRPTEPTGHGVSEMSEVPLVIAWPWRTSRPCEGSSPSSARFAQKRRQRPNEVGLVDQPRAEAKGLQPERLGGRHLR